MKQELDNRIPGAIGATTIESSETSDSTDVANFFAKNWLRELHEDLSYFIRHYVSLLTQALFYPIFYFVYHAIFDLQIRGKDNLKDLERPLLFVSNHIAFYDSFIFDLFTTPFVSKIPPYHFMGTTQVTAWYLKIFKYSGIMYIVYLLFGVPVVTFRVSATHSPRLSPILKLVP